MRDRLAGDHRHGELGDVLGDAAGHQGGHGFTLDPVAAAGVGLAPCGFLGLLSGPVFRLALQTQFGLGGAALSGFGIEAQLLFAASGSITLGLGRGFGAGGLLLNATALGGCGTLGPISLLRCLTLGAGTLSGDGLGTDALLPLASGALVGLTLKADALGLFGIGLHAEGAPSPKLAERRVLGHGMLGRELFKVRADDEGFEVRDGRVDLGDGVSDCG